MVRYTGFTPLQVEAIKLRDGGMCAMRGTHDRCTGVADTANHRLNRGAGGSQQRNGLSNGCGICNICNGLIEHDSELADIARRRGIKLREGITTPTEVPIWSPFFRQWCVLTDDDLRLTGETDELTMPTIEDVR